MFAFFLICIFLLYLQFAYLALSNKVYGKDMDERYPKYGMLGFDTGYFFLKGLARYGSSFEKNMQGLDLIPIQTGFKFQRVNNWGGFINKKVFFVHFTKNFELVKLDFD